ncbi:S41 family peptidase [Maribellus sp. YY47]|uniref:S41 family peptidase n=1 Tax=Maribellus sp. YY47 TaxID=2929486 RepID=UPI002001B963|nr:S41 family peptidase [Maribellus sp. YY47]MCK3684766.1 S41 family peptidase [Maribellus sp. YY47]
MSTLNNKYRNRNKITFLAALVLTILFGCNEGEVPDPGSSIPEHTLNVNKFIFDVMSDVYLWYDELPDIDYTKEDDSKKYFSKLLYEDDKWSYITDDVEALENSFQGIETSFGWSLAFGIFSNTGNLFAIVEYVYPNTPAANAGLKRGDIIALLNDGDITLSNYTDLVYAESIKVTLGILSNDGISPGSSVSMTALELQLNPVLKTAVVEESGHKIGYLFYAQYIAEYNDAIDTALQGLLEQNITDLVLDLRYNPGGTVSAAQHLCSSLAPIEYVNNNDKLVTFQWNDKYQDYFEYKQFTSQIQVNFVDSVPVKLDLDNIHILTGYKTASASELTITGLNAYIPVTIVGDTTYGKYTASITLKPEDYYEKESYYSEFNNWGLQPIVLRYANALGVTDFKDGFIPDILVDDDLLNAYPLGDKNDPLFKAAIEDITGTTIVASKSAKKTDIPYKLFDRAFSKYDKNKRNLLMDNDNTKLIKDQFK